MGTRDHTDAVYAVNHQLAYDRDNRPGALNARKPRHHHEALRGVGVSAVVRGYHWKYVQIEVTMKDHEMGDYDP